MRRSPTTIHCCWPSLPYARMQASQRVCLQFEYNL
jgi:hypothetical protein